LVIKGGTVVSLVIKVASTSPPGGVIGVVVVLSAVPPGVVELAEVAGNILKIGSCAWADWIEII